MLDPSVHAYTLSEAYNAASTVAFASSNHHWLPVKTVQFLLDFVHLSTGLPWWASIVAATLLVRVTLLPLAVSQYRNGARMTVMRPEMTRVTEDFKRRMQSEGGVSMAERLQHKQRMQGLMLKYRCNPLKSLVMPLVLAPVFISFFSAIQSMQELHPSFHSGGLAHVMDLGAADPYWVLPVLNAVTMLVPMELLPDPNGVPEKDRQRMKLVFRVVAVLFIVLGQSMPAGLFVYWIASNTVTIFQQAILRSPTVRRALDIPDVSTVAPMENSPLDFLFGKKSAAAAAAGATAVPGTVKEAVVLRNATVAQGPQPPVIMFKKPAPQAASKKADKQAKS